ncbi:Protein of unknown function [Sanguibacter gelidistatuariae]|uniref:DUF4125 domain-containing protein n=1 Tax=Sanguibacter gelidistatuariae TaxID=1814289 RepID=A0A1G6XLS7_9MICO|nr:DUF4125 family protein [Sanguibacter gelidistatuariae]SDD79100.1 Protein of unknown function [Sanguibacter gelidistatuariae]
MSTQRENRLVVAREIVAREWAQFQRVNNEGGRADCQGDWPTFHQMRISQFLTWPLPLLDSYAGDLEGADATGRNLLTEKYARMMASTEPVRYAREIAPRLPVLDVARVARQEAIITVQVGWALAFRERYPRLGQAMRVLRTPEDTLTDTSFETYLRGELGTYSHRTLGLYEELVEVTSSAGENLTGQTITWTVVLGGFADLDEAEAAQDG